MGPRALPILETLAKDPDSSVRRTVQMALRNFGPEAIPALRVLADPSETHWQARREAAWQLKKLTGEPGQE
jgi:HEAT repeat protein